MKKFLILLCLIPTLSYSASKEEMLAPACKYSEVVSQGYTEVAKPLLEENFEEDEILSVKIKTMEAFKMKREKLTCQYFLHIRTKDQVNHLYNYNYIIPYSEVKVLRDKRSGTEPES